MVCKTILEPIFASNTNEVAYSVAYFKWNDNIVK